MKSHSGDLVGSPLDEKDAYAPISTNAVVRELQRTIGLAIAMGSIGSVSLSFYYLTSIFERSLLEAVSHSNVWFTSIWISVGFYTAFSKNEIAQWIQVYAPFAVACMSAITADQGDLTSLLFLGIGLALGLAYDKFTRRPILTLSPVFVSYFTAVIISIDRWTDQPTVFILLWITGATMICVIFWAIGKAAWQEIKRRKTHLEEQIRLRTEALEKSLARSEALQERNATLLKEIHHRTKNNLQIVASLLSLQRGTKNIKKSADEILDEAERRVRTMAKTHEMFHDSDGVSIVGVEQFVRAITESYLRSGLITSLYIETDAIKGVAVEMDVAIPLGLIINELFSNVVQHAYAEDLPERPIWVFLTYQEGWLTATVEDHGIGIPESVEVERLDSGGLRIVKALADQINASLSLCRNPFTTWIIRTPVTAEARVGDVGA